MKFNRDMLCLYAVTDRKTEDISAFLQQVEAALRGGVTMVQLREKHLADGELLNLARQVRDLCHRYGVPFIVNDRWDIALQAEADGVHVGIEDAPVAGIRMSVPAGFIIGATAKTVDQAKAAQAAGADYLGVGAVFPSPTKEKALRITRSQLDEICSSVSIPVTAIGGISAENIEELSGADIAGTALVSAIFGVEDIEGQTRKLKEKVIKLTSK